MLIVQRKAVFIAGHLHPPHFFHCILLWLHTLFPPPHSHFKSFFFLVAPKKECQKWDYIFGKIDFQHFFFRCFHIRVIYLWVLTRKPLEAKEFKFIYLCSLSSNTLFIRKQNDFKLQPFCIHMIIFKSLNGNNKWPTLFVNSVFVLIQIKKICYRNCRLGPSITDLTNRTSYTWPVDNTHWWITLFHMW